MFADELREGPVKISYYIKNPILFVGSPRIPRANEPELRPEKLRGLPSRADVGEPADKN